LILNSYVPLDRNSKTMLTSIDETKINQTRTQLDALTRNLLEALENGDRGKVLAAQQAFTDTISTLWNATEDVNMDPKLKAILRLVAGWAIYELPGQIEVPSKDEQIKRELKLFQRSLMMFR
jgi:hypothetical protein